MIFCSFGFCRDLLEEKLSWLEKDPKRALIFVDEKKWAIDHPQVSVYAYSSPLQLYPIATEIGQRAVFLSLDVVNTAESNLFSLFEEALLEKHRLSNLCLSDAADFGCTAYKNAKKNLETPFISYKELKGAFRDLPAVIVGAGPSLENHAHHFPNLCKKALVFAGGNGLNKVPSKPHFGAILDKQEPKFSFPHKDIPLCFQSRGYPVKWEGERVLFPESHFSFLNTLSSMGSLDSGWTVGNFMAQIALFFGCNPIISVGMDYCLREGKKYAFDSSLTDETHEDWTAAVQWMRDLAKKNPDTKFYKTSGGLDYLPEFNLDNLTPIQEFNVEDVLISKPKSSPVCFKAFEESLKKMDETPCDELFEPLWKLWRPIFARELELSDMEIHKQLFFEQVKYEYLNEN